MEFLQKNARAIGIALIALLIVLAISFAGSNNDSETENGASNDAQTSETTQEENENGEDGTKAEDEQTAQPENDEEATPVRESVQTQDDNYTISAVAGDNQTVLVRDIIAQYETDNDVELSAEQRLFTETNLVNALPRSDVILVGDTVRLSKEDVASVFEEAQNLNEAQLAAWAAYL